MFSYLVGLDAKYMVWAFFNFHTSSMQVSGGSRGGLGDSLPTPLPFETKLFLFHGEFSKKKSGEIIKFTGKINKSNHPL